MDSFWFQAVNQIAETFLLQSFPRQKLPGNDYIDQIRPEEKLSWLW